MMLKRCADTKMHIIFGSTAFFYFVAACLAADGVYRVDRRDFVPTQSSAPRSLGYRHLVNGRDGVYQVSRQDFTKDNAPFSENSAPHPGYVYGDYLPEKVPYSYGRENGYTVVPRYQPMPPTIATLLPRLFVPAEPRYDPPVPHQPNYHTVLSLSEYNRRFERPTPPPLYSQPRAIINPQWMISPTAPPSTPASPASSPSTTSPLPPFSSVRPYFLQPITGVYVDDGVLPPIQSDDAENEPLPPVAPLQPSTRDPFVAESQDAAGNHHTQIKYHSFNEFVEISDEHRELLESFGSIQNNESDFSELPETSPIRRRRSAHSNLYEVYGLRTTWNGVDTYTNRLWQQMRLLGDLKRALHDAKYHQNAVSPDAGTIIVSDDSTIVVFNNSNKNIDGKFCDQMAVARADDAVSAEIEPFVAQMMRYVSGRAAKNDDSSSSGRMNWVQLFMKPFFAHRANLDGSIEQSSEKELNGVPRRTIFPGVVFPKHSIVTSVSAENLTDSPHEFPTETDMNNDTITDAVLTGRNASEYIIYLTNEDKINVPVTEDWEETSST